MNQIVDTNVLFQQVLERNSIRSVAEKLCVRMGTIDRWIRHDVVPPFYKNDLLRMLDMECHTGIEESDQFYTIPEVATACIDFFHTTLAQYDIDLDGYIFVEPSAGCGHFYTLLPENRRIGIDIDPHDAAGGIIKSDFLRWHPPQGKYVVIGNPPFGRNGKTALDFVLKSFEFADFVGLILPPIFNSTGKGSCHNRLINMGRALLDTTKIPDNAFIYPDGREVAVKTIFQVWAHTPPQGYEKKARKTCNSFVEIRNIYLSYKPSRPSSHVDLVGKCDIYIPRSFWGSKPIMATMNFDEIPYKDGYGVIIKKRKSDLLGFIKGFDWREVAHQSTNGSMSLRKDIIIDALVKRGFVDD